LRMVNADHVEVYGAHEVRRGWFELVGVDFGSSCLWKMIGRK